MRPRGKKEEDQIAPHLIVADAAGTILEVPELLMAGMGIRCVHLPAPEELIPLPFGSNLYVLPGRIPIGYDPDRDELVEVPEYAGRPVQAVAAFMAPAHTWIYRAAYRKTADAPVLPLFAYAAVGWQEGDYWVAGVRVDPDIRQDPAQFNLAEIERRAEEVLRRYAGNRLVRHLVENCVRRYGCPAARNFVLGRWECPVPTSPGCNAACVGCLSLQPSGSPPASQDRIEFVPAVDEIVEFCVPHLESAPEAIISFGQGCEGEPLLVADVLEESIREIRKRTRSGTINLNTNAFDPEAVERLCRAGLDSIRVSLASAQNVYYERYFQPRDYGFEDVLESIRVAKRQGVWVSLNYFVFPGFTDHPAEMHAFFELLQELQPDMVQTRNLNLDPDLFLEQVVRDELDDAEAIGILNWLEAMRRQAPWLRVGYFNPPVHRLRVPEGVG
ncbi:MAG: radical SAM protein [candidate division KSB1 bacterium]|nr:radical SAM protein [candidate division KSB1 bacterium]